MEQAVGTVHDIDDKYITFKVPIEQVNFDNFVKRNYQKATVLFHDARGISPEQRNKAWALISDIAEWQHGFKNSLALDDTNCDMKREFIARTQSNILTPDFSLSDCDMTLAREYVSFLIEFVLAWEVPTKKPLIQNCDDIEHYMLACLMNKKCAICNKPGELHHFDAIGAGRNRDSILQLGMRVLSLCREHHTIGHTKARNWLTKEMHLVPLALTEEIGRVYGLTRKNLGLTG